MTASDGADPARPVVTVRALTHRVGGRSAAVTVLRDVALAVVRGEVVALAGRSGSGKTTLCHLLAGVTRPTAGTVDLDGTPAADVRDWARLTLLPQRLALVDELSVAENVAWPCRLRGRPVPPGLLEDLGLAAVADRPVVETSLGEQQRAGLGRALATRPELAVLDEPTGHQDDTSIDRVLAALAAASRAGTAVVVATHDQRLLQAADRVVHLRDGRVAAAEPRPDPTPPSAPGR